MKKITLIVCALVTAVASFAMVKEAPKKIFTRSSVPSITYVDAKLDNASAKSQAAGLDTVFVQYRAIGAYQVGVPSDGLRYGFYQQGLVAPYNHSILYVNNDTLVSSWFIGGEQVGEGVYYEQQIGFGEFELPVMKTPKTKTTYYGDYQVAALNTADWQTLSPNFYNALNVAPAGFATFTKCAMYTEDARQAKDGSDWKLVGAGQLGSYSYGSHLTNPWDGGYFDTIFVPFFQDGGTMYIDHMTLGIYNSGNSSDEYFPGENDHVRLSIYPINEEGEIEWENALYRATANIDNFTEYWEGYSYLGLLQFNFLDVDPITGAKTPTPIIVNGDFVVAFDEYNEGTTNVGFICDYYSKLPGQTYFVGRDQETGEQYITTLWKSPSNIMLNLVAFLPAFDLPESVDVDLEGGVIELDVPSNVWDEDLEFESDEWIEFAVVTEYEEEEYQGEIYYNHKYVNHVTITVQEADAPRSGVIEIDAAGKPITIIVNQGGKTAVDNVTIKNDGKFYNVLGIEVGDDYKGVVIRNGEKSIR